MSRFIRWQGLATFAVIVGLIVAFVYIFAETLVKNGIEYGGGHYLGAEVNVESVEINYNPLQLHINTLQATDPASPNQNTFSFAKASAGLDVWQYFFGKILIDELAIEALAFSTPRDSEGEVYQPIFAMSDEEGDGLSAMLSPQDISLPDPAELLKEANLETVKQGELLKTAYQEEKTKLEALKANLPSKEKLAGYEEQVKALSKTKVKSLADVEKIKADFDKIKKQFEADKAIVEKAKAQLASSKAILTERTTALKNAPQQDWKNIESTYQLDKIDGGDFAHMLFGEKARDYYEMAEGLIEKIRPLMAGKTKEEAEELNATEGRFVHFQQDNPQPEILINTAKFSVVSPQGDFNIELSEVTHQHWYRNNPTLFKITSDNVQGSGKANLAGKFSVNKDSAVTSDGQWEFNGVGLTNIDLQKSDKLSMAIDSANLGGSGNFTFVNNNIGAINQIKLSNAAFSGGGSSKVAGILLDTLKSMDNMTIGADITGNIKDPQWQIKSPLDNLLKNALSQQVNKQVDKFKSQIQTGLNEKLAGELQLNEGSAGEFLQFDKLLSGTDASLDSLINSDVVDSQKDMLKNKVEDKIKDKLGDLFN